MTDDRLVIDRLEFYITNVCNLTCSNCNRYNNYKFSGWQKWEDHEQTLFEWSKKIKINQSVIMGGEPLLNPDICKWVNGIGKLWSTVQILTNGTQLTKTSNLYKSLPKKSWIGITVHHRDDVEDIFSRVRQFLTAPIVETSDDQHPTGSKYQFVDKNQKRVYVWVTDTFVSSNLTRTSKGKFKFYNSNPELAHANCTFSKFKNYHMIGGKIYKCGPVALMPEFVKQHEFELDGLDLDLLNAYQPLTVDQFDSRGLDFFANIDRVIPQCKFCPEHYETNKIEFTDLKKSWKIEKYENTTQ
jgi:organic radical activating enzyme